MHELLNQILAGNIICRHIICSDINRDLISIWNMLKDKDERVELYEFYCMLHKQLKERCGYIEGNGLTKEDVAKMQTLYYEMRDKYNSMIDQNDDSRERTMIFYWLTRTCFNGLIRYNPKNNHFNSPFHTAFRFGITPDKLKSVFDSWSGVIDAFTEAGGTIEFLCKSYRDVICDAKEGDVVYMDPPYENSKYMYFCKDIDADEFFEILGKMNKGNVKWLLSYDGMMNDSDKTSELPIPYKRHEYVYAGTSSFNRINFNARDVIKDSLYLNY